MSDTTNSTCSATSRPTTSTQPLQLPKRWLAVGSHGPAPIPGEALWHPHHTNRFRLPGQRPERISIWPVIERFAILLVAACAAAWGAVWITDEPMPDCISLAAYSYPELEYHGWDGNWILNGRLVGWSLTEDASCISPR